ncbi:MAG: hypothetical protein E6J87_10760 [Deltaproteobacteria bacterium]|nr:MAG: hypothetical protein E6J87_10760 [Deltaproteobacteria bacterium]
MERDPERAVFGERLGIQVEAAADVLDHLHLHVVDVGERDPQRHAPRNLVHHGVEAVLQHEERRNAVAVSEHAERALHVVGDIGHLVERTEQGILHRDSARSESDIFFT